MSRDKPDVTRAEDRIHRRYWGYANRPYGGCGCLWMLITIFLIYLVVSLLYAPFRFGYW